MGQEVRIVDWSLDKYRGRRDSDFVELIIVYVCIDFNLNAGFMSSMSVRVTKSPSPRSPGAGTRRD